MKRNQILTLFFIAVSLVLVAVLTVQLFPLIREVVTNADDESNIVSYVDAYGVRGVPILIGLSAIQVIIPVIPAPAVGVLAGLCYGIIWGPLIFLGGCVLGNLFVFVSVRQLGGLITPHIRHKKTKHKKLLSKERLKKIKRPEIVAFFCFLIPGLSSMLPYLFAGTKISLVKYLLAAFVGNIPSAMFYVFLGDRMSQGNYTTAILVAAVAVVAILALLPFRKKIMNKIMQEEREDGADGKLA